MERSKLAAKIFLVNVGSNASHNFTSPIFRDGTFEFLPIPETPILGGEYVVRYRDFRSHYDPEKDLLKYIPESLWNISAHADPEFDTFTYGDNCELSPRAASLKQIGMSDYLFFITRLENWDDDAAKGTYGFYMIGFLEVDALLKDVTEMPEPHAIACFGRNAHIKRGFSDRRLWDRFWVISGSKFSRRFDRAVPVTREIANQVFFAADGSPWRWDSGRTDLQVIGSYTRTCRCVINPLLPGQQTRSNDFWQWVNDHSNF